VHQNTDQYYSANVAGLGVGPFDEVIICGNLSSGITDFGGLILYPGSTGDWPYGDYFLARLRPNGDIDWAHLINVARIAVDRTGSIYAGLQNPDGTGLAKLDSTGAVIWSEAIGLYIEGMTLDSEDEPVFCGQFDSTVVLGGVTLSPRGFFDFYVAKADAQGDIQWAMSGGGTGTDVIAAPTCGPDGSIYLRGHFMNTASPAYFDGLVLPRRGLIDYPTAFVAKLSPVPPLHLSRIQEDVTLAWPSKATNYVLEATTSLPSGSWATVTNTPTVSGRDRNLQLPLTDPAQFFRLRKP
jgi:hypothetical protein